MPKPWEPADPDASHAKAINWLHTFCENWLFAFIVAMGIRHFCLEAFQIPTASMEPMLYGDPGWMKRDNVVVDKLFSRFSGVDRWDVTVFQFPLPEVESSKGERARPAIASNGDRLDRLFTRPLLYANFVKRAVGLPGDTFYIAGGDIFLKGVDGGFAPAQKPVKVQAALWMPIYRAGAQAGYLPWEGSSGAGVQAKAETLSFAMNSGEVRFTQPLRNLYLKPGPVRVAVLGDRGAGEIVEAGMLTPQFSYDGRTGSIWDLDQWQLRRHTSADLDSASHGRDMNAVMDEWVADVRITAAVTALTGSVSGVLQLGSALELALVLEPTGWRLEGPSGRLAGGTQAIVGSTVSLAHLDGMALVTVAGIEVFRGSLPWADPNSNRPTVLWRGPGTATLSGLTIDRDVHYTARGFLKDEGAETKRAQAEVSAALSNPAVAAEDLDGVQRQFDLYAKVRAQLLGKAPAELRNTQRTGALASSATTAVTIPQGNYLLMGDNSPFSWDGRNWGLVPAENIRGEALAVFFPPWRWRVVR